MNESRYRLVRPLAVGGMAELFLGVAKGAEGFEKPVAIKRMLPHLASEPAIAKMFLAEAQLATRLQHQNIASVYDVGRGPEGLFLVMELVNGWDLGVLLRHASRRNQRFPPHLVAFIGAQALAGLIHAYRRLHAGRPVLTAHRDVSPSNILVSREGEVKVTDFGIARVEGAGSGTQPGTFKGKLPYSAPEALHGQPATALCDQFSLGIVLYELLAGHHPFAQGDQEPLAFALAISQKEPPPLEGVPAPLVAVVMRALSKKPEERFAQPEDMAEALGRYLSQAGEIASPHALATFVKSLSPPLTLVEMGESADTPSFLEAPSTAPTVRRPSHTTRAVDPPSFELQSGEDWDDAAGGLQLSTSGRLILPGDPPASAKPSSREPAPRPASPAGDVPAPAPPFSREHTFTAESFSSDPSAVPEPPAPPAPLPPSAFAPPPVRQDELQWEDRPPKPVSTFPLTDAPSPAWRRWVKTLGKLALLLAVAGAVVVGIPYLKPRLEAARYRLNPLPQVVSTLSIQSEPSGAAVSVDGTPMGTTPLYVDNVYPAGRDIPVQVTLKGYKPWKGSFTGGQAATLDVTLTRR